MAWGRRVVTLRNSQTGPGQTGLSWHSVCWMRERERRKVSKHKAIKGEVFKRHIGTELGVARDQPADLPEVGLGRP